MCRAWVRGHHPALSFSGSHFVDTSALIRLPDDCTVGYIIECKLGGHLQPSPLFHSHLETLQLLGAAQLLEQVSQLPSRGRGVGEKGLPRGRLGYSKSTWNLSLWSHHILVGKQRPREQCTPSGHSSSGLLFLPSGKTLQA